MSSLDWRWLVEMRHEFSSMAGEDAIIGQRPLLDSLYFGRPVYRVGAWLAVPLHGGPGALGFPEEVWRASVSW
ncbi:MAG: hypothetical protein VX307_06970 [Chloroflexota bacterium]|nr:hypothetical protein [Chloroflexota bacterium]